MKRRIAGFIVIPLIALYYFIGFFPISRFETDSMAVANSCQHMINSGVIEENLIGHSYHMQSGTYFLIVNISRLTGADTFTVYSVITIVSSIIAFYLTVLILHVLLAVEKWKIALLLFLFQEITALGYYPNSAIIAIVFFLLAFYLLLKYPNKKTILASTIPLLALAAWMRADIAFAFPSLLFILNYNNKKFFKSTLQSILLGAGTIIMTIFLMWLMNARVAGFFGYTDGSLDFNKHAINMGLLDFQIIRTHLSFFSVLLMMLIVIGLYHLIRQRNWNLLLIWFSGVIVYYLLGTKYCSAPKHLSYFLIFWALVALSGFKFVSIKSPPVKRIFSLLIIMLFVLQYIIGYNFEIESLPYVDKEYSRLNPNPVFLRLAEVKLPNKKVKSVQLVIGVGTKIPSVDEVSASSGISFSPLMWYNQKYIYKKDFDNILAYINNSSCDTIKFLITDGSAQFLLNTLMSNGYQWNQEKYQAYENHTYYEFNNAKNTIVLHRYVGFQKNAPASFSTIFIRMPHDEFIAVFLWDWQKYVMQEHLLYEDMIGTAAYKVKKSAL